MMMRIGGVGIGQWENIIALVLVILPSAPGEQVVNAESSGRVVCECDRGYHRRTMRMRDEENNKRVKS